jgi:hypothetical protein
LLRSFRYRGLAYEFDVKADESRSSAQGEQSGFTAPRLAGVDEAAPSRGSTSLLARADEVIE